LFFDSLIYKAPLNGLLSGAFLGTNSHDTELKDTEFKDTKLKDTIKDK
jgi:hypothetical protein